MNIFGMHFHSWVSLMKNKDYYFEGEKLSRYVEVYRMCKECGEIQENHYDSQGGYWSTLPKIEHDIIKLKIKNKKITIDD